MHSMVNELKEIKADLVIGQSCNFPQLTQALQTWKEMHPVEATHNNKPCTKPPPSSRGFQSQQGSVQPRWCICRYDVSDRSAMCQVVKPPRECKQKLQEKGLCCNCTGRRHQAAQCQSCRVCQHCKKKHSSICGQVWRHKKLTMIATQWLSSTTMGSNVECC